MRVVTSACLFALVALPLGSLACSVEASSTSSSTSSTEPLQEVAKDAGAHVSGYPAFTPPPPALSLHGGSVLHAPKFQLVRFASDHGAGAAQTLLEKMPASSYWTETTSEYGVGPMTMLPEVVLSAAPPSQIDDSDIQAWLLSQLDVKNTAGLAPSDGETVYVWTGAATTKITSSSGTSCFAFGGYHDVVTRANGQRVPYIVLPRCKSPRLSIDDQLAFALSHEMVETATDPVPETGYVVPESEALPRVSQGGEVGDLCWSTTDPIRPADLGLATQRIWSNAAAAAGHDPCVPAQGSVNFGAFADVPDRNGGHAVLKLAGRSVTLGVKLFSEAPMSELTVVAADLATMEGSKPELHLEFADGTTKAKGKNGDVLELTISPLARAELSGESVLLLEATSADGKTKHRWAALVMH